MLAILGSNAVSKEDANTASRRIATTLDVDAVTLLTGRRWRFTLEREGLIKTDERTILQNERYDSNPTYSWVVWQLQRKNIDIHRIIDTRNNEVLPLQRFKSVFR